jgi:hypothetical protein
MFQFNALWIGVIKMFQFNTLWIGVISSDTLQNWSLCDLHALRGSSLNGKDGD